MKATTQVLRKEIKFLMNAQEALLLRSRLDALMVKDPHSGQGPYFIRSVYFDTKFSTSYFEKTEGLEHRKKFRLRLYDLQASEVRFEIKIKHGEQIDKRSAWVRGADVPALLAGGHECLMGYGDPVLRQIYYDFSCQSYEPCVVVDYFRDAYLLDFNHIRVTFDQEVRRSRDVRDFRSARLLTVPVMERGCCILEIKYNDFFPGWLKDALEVSRFQRSAYSKYSLARMI